MATKVKPLERLEKLRKRAQVARDVNTNPVEVSVSDLEWLLGFATAILIVDDDADDDEGMIHICGDCGARLDIVRPGKWQCPNCE